MNFEKFFNAIGLGLLAFCIGLSLFRVLSRGHIERNSGQITIRLAHWQLENGVRDAYETVAKEYTKLHPNVKVEQLLVPERIYPNWATTQLVGGTAPDIVELGKGAEIGDRVARYFLPSTEVADLPNPYNKGTPLEGMPWRSTFVDGMEGAYREDLADYYGIPNFMITVRVYYNRDLLKEITGEDEPPTSYDEFTALCDQVKEFSRRPENRHRRVLPLAGSKYNAPIMMDRLAASQTQKFDMIKNSLPVMTNSGEESALNYLKGYWNLRSEPILAGLELQRNLGSHMPPGFMQLGREDSTLYFVQQRALMIVTGSWDVSSIHMLAEESGFGVGAFRIPLPDRQHPKYGKNVLGLGSEADNRTVGAMAIYRGSKNRDIAIDFLQYLTSLEGHTLWCSVAKWPPIVVGVQPHERAKPFMPISEGEIDGKTLKLLPGPTSQARLLENAMGDLMDPTGSVEAFIERVEGGIGPALVVDLNEATKNRLRSIRRQDGNIVSAQYMATSDPTNPRAISKLDSLWENQLSQELLNAHVQHDLEAIEAGVYEQPTPSVAAQ